MPCVSRFQSIASLAFLIAFSQGGFELVANEPIYIETHRTLEDHNLPVKLIGSDARWQLLVSQKEVDGPRDITREVDYLVQPTGVVMVDSTGMVIPLRNGQVTLIASKGAIQSEPLAIEVSRFDDPAQLNFPNQVVPVFTKLGCNSGGCHGKLAGQNGFRLSLLGFEPQEDFEHLIKESRGRRLFPAAPDRSLLLQKAINASPHGGGQKLDVDTPEYRLLRRWIEQSMPYGKDTDPTLASIELIPNERRMQRETHQQLSVIARYSDGSVENITRTVQFESNGLDMAEVSSSGLVSTRQLAGDVSVMARYQGKVAVFRASIPLGATLDQWPESRGRIDDAVFAKLKNLGIPPSKECDDGTFLRRVTLDIAGRLPTIEETQQFLADQTSNKRSVWIDRMLESDGYADSFATKWNSILRNRKTTPESQFGSFVFHDWIRQSLYENKPFDRFVREIVTASGTIEAHPPVVWFREVNNVESRVEDAAQLFLGQRIQCARCHHHPFEKWSQSDYYQMSAFFSTMEKKEGRSTQDPVFVSKATPASAAHPKTGKSLKPAGLDSKTLELDSSEDPRKAFAEWMVDKDNPFFAKSLVNRYWKHFLGKGLIEPEDDLRITNPPSNPELLEALASDFVESGFDLKQLVRAICNSSTYQISSDSNEFNQGDSNGYSRYYPKRMNAEVLLDSIDLLCGTETPFDGMPAGTKANALPHTAFGSYFLTVFGRPESSTACECERSQTANLAQCLHLLNSKEVQSKVSNDTGRAASWATQPLQDESKRIQEIYLQAFCRLPTDAEKATALSYIERKRSKVREAYEDLVWAIINSKEFLFNH